VNHNLTHGKALFMLLADTVVPAMPTEFTITTLVNEVQRHTGKMNGRELDLLRKRVKDAMVHICQARDIARSVVMTDINAAPVAITQYTQPHKN
jgi:hypothetical protein